MSNPGPSITRSRWFKRGWTLQELLAPRYRYFYDQKWNNIGYFYPGDSVTAQAIGRITGVDYRCLSQDSSLYKASVAARMSWAAHRSTTRQEDMAYCLLGIFDVNMPLLYGEGEKAFIRLQEEIVRRSDDETILSWHYGFSIGDCPHGGLFAKSPRCFENCGAPTQRRPEGTEQKHYSLTNKGLYIKPSLYQFGSAETWAILLNCSKIDRLYSSPRRSLAVPVVAHGDGETHSKGGAQYWRPEGSLPFFIDQVEFTRLSLRHLYLRYEESNDYPYALHVNLQNLGSLPLRLTYVHPPHSLAVQRSEPPEPPREFLDDGKWTEIHLIVQPVLEGKAFLLKIAYTYSIGRFGPSSHNTGFHGHVSHTVLASAYDIKRFQHDPLEVIRGVMKWEPGNLIIGGRYFKISFELSEHLLVKFPVLSFQEM